MVHKFANYYRTEFVLPTANFTNVHGIFHFIIREDVFSTTLLELLRWRINSPNPNSPRRHHLPRTYSTRSNMGCYSNELRIENQKKSSGTRIRKKHCILFPQTGFIRNDFTRSRCGSPGGHKINPLARAPPGQKYAFPVQCILRRKYLKFRRYNIYLLFLIGFNVLTEEEKSKVYISPYCWHRTSLPQFFDGETIKHL